MIKPMIYTLEGYADTGNVAPYAPTQSFFDQNYETLGAFYEVWRPSQLKKTAGVLSIIAGAAAAIPSPATPVLLAISAGAGATAGAAAAVHATYRDKDGNIIEVPEGQQPPPGSVPAKANVTVPIVVGAIGALAALAIAS